MGCAQSVPVDASDVPYKSQTNATALGKGSRKLFSFARRAPTITVTVNESADKDKCTGRAHNDGHLSNTVLLRECSNGPDL